MWNGRYRPVSIKGKGEQLFGTLKQEAFRPIEYRAPHGWGERVASGPLRPISWSGRGQSDWNCDLFVIWWSAPMNQPTCPGRSFNGRGSFLHRVRFSHDLAIHAALSSGFGLAAKG